MKRAVVVIALLSASCGGLTWGTFEGGPRTPYPEALGVLVAEGHPLRPTQVFLDTSTREPLVAVVTAAGVNGDVRQRSNTTIEFFRVDLETRVSTKLPPLPFYAETFTFHLAADPRAALISSDNKVAYFDGTAWRRLADLPVSSVSRGQLLALDGARVVGQFDGFSMLDGATWRQVATRGVLGPVATNGFRVLSASIDNSAPWPYQVCTQRFSWQGVEADRVCFDNIDSDEVQPAANGTLDSFHAKVGDTLLHFLSGRWTRGNELKGALQAAPTLAQVSVQGAANETWLVSGGSVRRRLAPQFAPALGEFTPEGEVRAMADGSGLVVAGTVVVDARRYITARKLEFTSSAAEFGPVCELECPSGHRCQAVDPVNNGGRTQGCVADDLLVNVGLPRARVTMQLSGVDAGDEWAVSLLPVDGGAVGMTVETPPPALTLVGDELTPFVLVVTRSGHAPSRHELTSPYAGRVADLGRIPLVAAPSAGVTWGNGSFVDSLNTLVLPQALVVRRVEGDGGTNWLALQKSDDGGISTRVLSSGRVTQSTVVAPAVYASRANRLFIANATSLQAWDATTLEPRGEVPGTDWTMRPMTNASHYVAVGREQNRATRVRIEPTSLAVQDQFNVLGYGMWSSGTGAVVVRDDGPSAWFVGGRRVMLDAPVGTRSSPQVLDGAGTRFYDTVLSGVNGAYSTGIDTDSGVRVFESDAGVTFAVGLTSSRSVRARRATNPDGGFQVTLHELFDGETFVSSLGEGGVPSGGVFEGTGAWGFSNFESGLTRVFRVDDGTLLEESVKHTYGHFDDSRLYAVEDCDTTQRACDGRVFSLDLATSRAVKAVTFGARYGLADERTVFSCTTGDIDNAGQLVNAQLLVADPQDCSLDTRFVQPSRGPSHALGAPCALFTVRRHRYEVDAWGRVTPRYDGDAIFCAP